MKFETKAIHVGQEPDSETGAVVPPIYATSTFKQIRPGETRGYDYTRSGNPSFDRLGRTLASLEGAEYATVFGSGIAAVTAMLSTFKSGDVILAEGNIYGCTYRALDQVFAKFGLSVEYCDFTDIESLGLIRKLKPALIWIESPTNPLLKVIDIAAVSTAAAAINIPVLVDNTFASPFCQQPLSLGATISLSSSTKYINGHSDCLGGVVVTNDSAWHQKMIFAQKALGLNPSPMDAWLIARGVKTLAVRMQAHMSNALAFAKYLEQHPLCESVRYPNLPSHPQHELAKRQMTGGSGIVTAFFKLSLEECKTFLGEFTVFALAESLGGVESLVCHPASMTHASVPVPQREKYGITDSLIRFSVGIEHISDLIADFDRALLSLGKRF